MRRKIKTRVTLLILYVFVVFISALLIFLFISEKSNRRIIKEVGKNKEHEIIQLFDIYTTALKKFTYDYSFWNETVEYLKKPDPTWAKENLQDATIIYNVDRILLIDSSFSIKYLYPPTLGSTLEFPFLTVENLKLIAAEDTLVHFFFQSGQNKITEVMGAPVRSNIDGSKQEKPAGWLFSFRNIDQEYLNTVSRISGGQVSLKTVRQQPVPSYDVESGKISVVVQFNNWRNEAVGFFNVDFISPFLDKIKKERNWFLFIFGLFGFILILVLYWFVQSNITRPFDLILKSLSTRNIKILEDAPNQTLEFEEIKFNIADFFAQETLIREINLRKEAEESLEKSEQRYQMIVESIPDVVWILDEAGRLIYVTPNVKSLTGYRIFMRIFKLLLMMVLPLKRISKLFVRIPATNGSPLKRFLHLFKIA
jgi:PAS domain-containing protein